LINLIKWIKRLTVVVLSTVALAQPTAITAAPEYFRYVREVAISQPGKQNYFVIDGAVWAHTDDLADIRLYNDATQLPYAISEEQAESSTLEREARILNLGVREGRTEFDIDVGATAEYNRVQLRLKATNFVASATVNGGDAIGGGTGRKLSTSTLYDFSREDLGNNFTLRVPDTTFRYLHVTISPSIAPRDILGASTSTEHETKAIWVSAGHCRSQELNGLTTKFTCDLDPGVPVARFLFTVPAGEINFRRSISVSKQSGQQLCGGSVSRIRLKSGGKEVVTENLAVGFCANPERNKDGNNKDGNTFNKDRVVIAIDNGDNTPLKVEAVEPQSLERRIYFDPAGRSSIKLFYGDQKLPAPAYDYARFFHKGADAAQAVIGVETLNPGYKRRPDERPWSERNSWVLWAAMLLTVAVLAILAFRGLASGSSVAG
jgi:hypothetical protein